MGWDEITLDDLLLSRSEIVSHFASKLCHVWAMGCVCFVSKLVFPVHK
jgi:hypothetical protein